jgi:hypothetical protein
MLDNQFNGYFFFPRIEFLCDDPDQLVSCWQIVGGDDSNGTYCNFLVLLEDLQKLNMVILV